MTIPTYGRTRTQNIPDYSGSNELLGRLYPALPVGGVNTGNYSSTHVNEYFWNMHANRVFEKAAVTMDTVHKGPPYRTGDAFSCLKYDWCVPWGIHGHGIYERVDRSYRYIGGFQPAREFSPLGVIDKFDFPNHSISHLLKTVNNLNHPVMTGLGDAAWKRTKPKLQQADGFVFTAELRDMPRMLRQTAKRYDQIWRAMGGYYTSKKEVLKGGLRIMAPKKVANDFLSQQFGWVPFVKDLIKFDNVVQNYHAMIAEAIHKNARWVRRRVSILAQEEVKTIRHESNAFRLHSVGFDPYFQAPMLPTYTVEEVKRTDITAVGKFMYYRPEFDVASQDQLSQWNQAQQFLTLTGFRATPSNIYNAIPWTWAIDWFSNVGDWVDSLTETYVDSIVSEYCFVMKHEKTVRRAIQFAPFSSGPRTFTFERTIDSKQRLKASSPYDFNLSWDSLTPRQLAIAAALGIGRFPKIAR